MRTLILVSALAISACARAEASRQPVQVDMQNVDLHVETDITLHVRHLNGQFVPKRQIPYLDDKHSYSVAVQAGEIAVDDLVKVAPGQGVVVDGNDLILDPAALMPAPSVHGKLTAVRIEGEQLVQTFGTGRGRAVASRPLSKNHIYWRCGQLSFGKLTMADTDLELIDTDTSDPFDFSVDKWQARLVAGYSKTLANRGLKAFMPDYNDLGGREVARR